MKKYTDKELEQYIFDIIYCSSLAVYVHNPKWYKELCDDIIKAIKYMKKEELL